MDKSTLLRILLVIDESIEDIRNDNFGSAEDRLVNLLQKLNIEYDKIEE